jgi:DNA-directed RNA polymerase specialized sigma24 family protein
MMEAVAIPPFERFYGEHAGDVLGYLRRLLGARAEDAWQETFLRALGLTGWARPARLGVHDRDPRRARRAAGEAPRGRGRDELAAGRDAAELARPISSARAPDGRPAAEERAAVVLRYGYDLPYAEIGAALGSSEGRHAPPRRRRSPTEEDT